MTKRLSAYAQGAAAFAKAGYRDDPAKLNPYKPNTRDSEFWWDGWLTAAEELYCDEITQHVGL